MNEFNIKSLLNVCIFFFTIALFKSFVDVFSVVAWGEFSTLRFSANDDLDTISYGHLGLTLLFLNICRMKYSSPKYYLFIYIFCVFLALLSMAIANSRSPFFVLITVIFIYLLSKKKKLKLLLFSFFLIFTILNIEYIDDFFTKELGMTFFSRIRIVLETGSDGYGGGSGRNSLFEYGIDLFVESPLFGCSFLLHNVPYGNGSYVHNIFIEAFMALGLFGGSLFLVLNMFGLFCTYRIFKYNSSYTIFGFLYLQFLFLGLSSRSLISLPNYWYMLIFVFSLSRKMFINNIKSV